MLLPLGEIAEQSAEMLSLIDATKFALLLLCIAGCYGTWYILLNNGTTAYMSHTRDHGPRILPGTDEPLKTVYIGVPSIDYQLTVLALFSWEVVDGSHPAASLFCFHFATQVACGWSLLMVEGLRRGHRWMIISLWALSRLLYCSMTMALTSDSIGTLGIVVQNAAYAVIVPLYLIIYLSTSPLVSSKQASHYQVDAADSATIPISMALGYILPTVLMSLPAPSVINFDQKQIFMAIWQMFPLWVAVLQTILPHLIVTSTKSQVTTASQIHKNELRSLRRLYVILLVVAGIGQVSTFTLLATFKWFPGLFASEFTGVINSTNVFVPRAMSPSTKMPSIGAGAHILLQYDELIGSISMALFTTVLYIHIYRITKVYNTWTTQVLGGIAALVLTGPLGYAVACTWARDELIAAEDLEDTKKPS